jgi:excisionase family DNA binding protein
VTDEDGADDDVMTPGQVAAFFRVSLKTLHRWDKTGVLPAFRTRGGHRRFRRSDVERAVADWQNEP